MRHSREMLFGFALAVVVGFLLTAGRTWSNHPTASGANLAALVALWVAARILVLTPFGWAVAVANTAFRSRARAPVLSRERPDSLRVAEPRAPIGDQTLSTPLVRRLECV